MFKDLLALVFPRKCPGCGRELVRQDGAVCVDCLAEIRQTGFHRTPQDNELYYRIAGKVSLDGAAAFCFFDKKGRVKRMIQGLKYKNQPQVGRYLGSLWGEDLAKEEFWRGVDHLVPVPLHRTREASRGYNQAVSIAEGIAGQLSAELQERALQRRRKTETQTRMGKEARWDNVKEVFEMRRPLGGHVAVVDDVATTGATLESCVRTLLAQESPPEKVSILTLCMARND